jgi:hypothetical protein
VLLNREGWKGSRHLVDKSIVPGLTLREQRDAFVGFRSIDRERIGKRAVPKLYHNSM